MERALCIAITGPTASGKSAFAVELAQKIGGEILCVDSATVYKGFDLGTAKPNAEQRRAVPHHLLDLLEPTEAFNAKAFVTQAKGLAQQVRMRGKVPIFVGGSYFYLRALEHGMYPTGGYSESDLAAVEAAYSGDSGFDGAKAHAALTQANAKAAQAIHPNDHYRVLRALALCAAAHNPSELPLEGGLGPEWIWVKYAMALSRPALHARIEARAKDLVSSGLLEETRGLMASAPKARPLGTIGYAECVQCLAGQLDASQLATRITENTRKLAKRQLTWLRSDTSMRFIDPRDVDRVELETRNLQWVLSN